MKKTNATIREAVSSSCEPSSGGKALIEFADESRCEQVAELLALLSSPKRLKILCNLTDCDRNVEELVQATGSSISATSQQLKLLTLAGLLERRREGRNIFYRLTDKKVLEVLHLLKNLYS